MNKKELLYIILGMIFLFSFPNNVFGEEYTSNVLEDFSYDVILPEKQTNKDIGYYDFQMNAGEEQTIQLKLYNKGDKPLTIAFSYNSAKTNSNGIIEYGVNQLETDDSLKIDFSRITNGPKKVVIDGKSEQLVDIKIIMPNQYLEGYIAGGIQMFPSINDEDNQDEKTKKNVIKNYFAFFVGVLIHENEPSDLKEEFQFNKVRSYLSNGEYNFLIDISNISGVFVEDMSLNITIREKNSNKTVASFSQNNMRMAPNTKIKIPLSNQNDSIKKGKYLTNIEIKSKSIDKLTWIKEFSISKVDASFFNQKKEPNESTFELYWILFKMLFFTGVIIFCTYVLLRVKYIFKQS